MCDFSYLFLCCLCRVTVGAPAHCSLPFRTVPAPCLNVFALSLCLARTTHSWGRNGLHPSEWPYCLWKRAGETLNAIEIFYGNPMFHRTHSGKRWSVRTFWELNGAKQNIFISFATEILIFNWVGFLDSCYLTTPFRKTWNGSFASCVNCKWFRRKRMLPVPAAKHPDPTIYLSWVSYTFRSLFGPSSGYWIKLLKTTAEAYTLRLWDLSITNHS